MMLKLYGSSQHKEHIKNGYCDSISIHGDYCRFRAKHKGIHLPALPCLDIHLWFTKNEQPRPRFNLKPNTTQVFYQCTLCTATKTIIKRSEQTFDEFVQNLSIDLPCGLRGCEGRAVLIER